MRLTFITYPREMYPTIPGLIEPFIEERFDMCPFCKAQRVELFSFNGYPQHYKEAVDYYINGYNVDYNQYEIRSMKCQGCGKEFTIDWSDGFPKPLRSSLKTSIFVSEFLMGI